MTPPGTAVGRTAAEGMTAPDAGPDAGPHLGTTQLRVVRGVILANPGPGPVGRSKTVQRGPKTRFVPDLSQFNIKSSG